MNTFPPIQDVAPQTGPVETPEGDLALERGRKIMAKYRSSKYDYPTMQEIESELGGPEGFFTMFGVHYCKLFANPRIIVLFDTRHVDTNVSALEHGTRLGSVLLARWHETNHFYEQGRGTSYGGASEIAH